MLTERMIDHGFSVFEAAKEVPDHPSVISDGEVITYSQMAEYVRLKNRTLSREVPFRLKAVQNLDTIVTIFTLLERKQPILLLHPGLTDFERNNLLESIAGIEQKLPDDAAVILFTSGTTGLPKPAVLTRKALWASASSSSKNIPLDCSDVWQLSISPARIGGFSIITRSLLARSTIALMPKFKVKTFLRRLETDGVTYASIVPTMLRMIFEEIPDWRPPRRLKALLVGGAPTSAKLKEEAHQKGIPLILTYGMTETASNVVTTPYEKRYEITEGCGVVNPDAELLIRDGRICIRGPMLMWGYWGRTPLQEDAWFDSGDLGEIDEHGRVKVFARRTDMIISGGENVYPAEVEEALERVPGIKEALVIGKPDETWGAIVTALLVPVDNDHLPSDASVILGLMPYLAAYKSPRRIAWVEKLPKTNAGKPDRSVRNLDGLNFHPLHYAHPLPSSRSGMSGQSEEVGSHSSLK